MVDLGSQLLPGGTHSGSTPDASTTTGESVKRTPAMEPVVGPSDPGTRPVSFAPVSLTAEIGVCFAHRLQHPDHRSLYFWYEGTMGPRQMGMKYSQTDLELGGIFGICRHFCEQLAFQYGVVRK